MERWSIFGTAELYPATARCPTTGSMTTWVVGHSCSALPDSSSAKSLDSHGTPATAEFTILFLMDFGAFSGPGRDTSLRLS